jgi:hypothetical protein
MKLCISRYESCSDVVEEKERNIFGTTKYRDDENGAVNIGG